MYDGKFCKKKFLDIIEVIAILNQIYIVLLIPLDTMQHNGLLFLNITITKIFN